MKRLVARLLTVAAIIGFVGLGVWQVERLGWKRALIARVERNVSAAPAPPPVAADRSLEYRRIVAAGRWLSASDTFVQAVTELGGGFWVMTPLATDRGVLLVNRGFAPDRESAAPPPAGRVRVAGLLRLTEADGGFLRDNEPLHDRWYSRDVAAIAAARGLGHALPYFMDADRQGAGLPRGGMTVITFRNHHLVYALTWFAMAGLLACLALRATRRKTRA